MSECIEFAVRVPKDEADSFIARFGKGNVRILGYLLGEEIVRCRDCKHASAGEAVISGNWQHGSCRNPRYRGSLHAANVRAGGFCSWGERRVDA